MSFLSVTYKNGMGRNPAQVNRRTGELFVNPDSWDKMPESFRRFILLHEEGHLKGGKGGTPTADEVAADLYAFRNYKNTEPGSLKKSVIALDALLGNSPEQIKRKLLIYSAALLEDYQHNGNKKALVEYFNVKAELKDYHNISIPGYDSDYSNWIGAAIGAVMSIVGVAVNNKAGNDLEDSQTQTEAQILNNSYEQLKFNDAVRDSEALKSVQKKYTLIILFVLFGLTVAMYLFLKKK